MPNVIVKIQFVQIRLANGVRRLTVGLVRWERLHGDLYDEAVSTSVSKWRKITAKLISN
jgi:hypothetical protein